MHEVSKGLFFATSTFASSNFVTACRLSNCIVLLEGKQLTDLMIRYSVGCRTEETLMIKRLEEEFFE